MAGELARRLAVAALGIPLSILLIYMGGWPLGIALAILAGLGVSELSDIALAGGVRPHRRLAAAMAAGMLIFAANGSAAEAGPAVASVIAFGTLLAAGASIFLRGPSGRPLEASAVTVYAGVLLGAGFGSAMLLRNLDPALAGMPSWQGAAPVAFPLAITWVGDSAAYFIGTRWGRHRLAPSVSPKKSVEGAVAGLVGSILAAAAFDTFVFGAWFGRPIGPLYAALGGALIGAVGQVGDLAESVMKREAGVKDSGRIFPGHGGVLDRFDALLFAMPAAFLYLAVILPRLIPGLAWR